METNKEKQTKLIQQLLKKDLKLSERKEMLSELEKLEAEGTLEKRHRRQKEVIESILKHKRFDKLTIYELINLRNAGLSFTAIANYLAVGTSTLNLFKNRYEKTYYKYFKLEKYKQNKAANFSWDERN
ncbi:DUF2481 family protein [Listeria seeligeri]|uniref:DUF2481 family protein n=1 Tax=Listeria seeligeri TaxID=1640 RepID=UPI001888B7D3|nr:DUF2481 family protein [Listeria seeligeri]MBF2653922.1 DUF2481 family protein [Listeria seeligeri]